MEEEFRKYTVGQSFFVKSQASSSFCLPGESPCSHALAYDSARNLFGNSFERGMYRPGVGRGQPFKRLRCDGASHQMFEKQQRTINQSTSGRGTALSFPPHPPTTTPSTLLNPSTTTNQHSSSVQTPSHTTPQLSSPHPQQRIPQSKPILLSSRPKREPNPKPPPPIPAPRKKRVVSDAVLADSPTALSEASTDGLPPLFFQESKELLADKRYWVILHPLINQAQDKARTLPPSQAWIPFIQATYHLQCNNGGPVKRMIRLGLWHAQRVLPKDTELHAGLAHTIHDDVYKANAAGNTRKAALHIVTKYLLFADEGNTSD